MFEYCDSFRRLGKTIIKLTVDYVINPDPIVCIGKELT